MPMHMAIASTGVGREIMESVYTRGDPQQNYSCCSSRSVMIWK
jgi:hypothetical protein